jgi:putative endonuclease
MAMSDDPRHAVGAAGEQLASDHLERRGFRILERNFRTRWGELDIVAYDGSTLVFCEVKARRNARGGVNPLESLHARKQARVRKMAGSWLSERPARPRARELRFDAIGITFDAAGRLLELVHLEGAF